MGSGRWRRATSGKSWDTVPVSQWLQQVTSNVHSNLGMIYALIRPDMTMLLHCLQPSFWTPSSHSESWMEQHFSSSGDTPALQQC